MENKPNEVIIVFAILRQAGHPDERDILANPS